MNERPTPGDRQTRGWLIWVCELMATKGPFSPEERTRFFQRLDLGEKVPLSEEIEGIFRTVASELPEEERSPIKIMKHFIMAAREGLKEMSRRQSSDSRK